MFKTLLTTLTMAGAFVGTVCAAERVTSSSGVSYRCPSIETIEVAYAESCPKNSRNSLFQYTGSTSAAFYSNAPSSYMTLNGDYSLFCSYGKNAQGQDVEPLQCRYRGGSGQALTPASTNTAECPDIGQSDPAPSPTPGTEQTSLAPAYNCPWDTTTPGYFNLRSIIYSGSFSGGNGAPIYQCAIRRANNLPNVSCEYNVDGVLRSGSSQDCPNDLCDVQRNMRRSLKRGVYLQDNPIHSRQVKAADLREAGKKRMPKPSAR